MAPRWASGMQRFGIATAAEVGSETLAARFQAEGVAAGGMACPLLLCGAWTSKRPE